MEIEKIIEYNRAFAADEGYRRCGANKRPARGLAVVSCMDTRLTELLSDALGLRDGDAVIIKNAGGIVRDMYGGEIRSLLVAVLELGVREIMIVGHTDCGVEGLTAEEMKAVMTSRGISRDDAAAADDAWLSGFDDVNGAVRESAELIKNHPLMPKDVDVRGFVMDIVTGELKEV